MFSSKIKNIFTNLFYSKESISNNLSSFIQNESNLKHFNRIQITINNPKNVYKNSSFDSNSTIYEAIVYFNNKDTSAYYTKYIYNDDYICLINDIKNTIENDLKI
jgi:hypothetical protein